VIDPVICFSFIKGLSSELRHAALVKREAFFAPGLYEQRRRRVHVYSPFAGRKNIKLHRSGMLRCPRYMSPLQGWDP
jgi:hypothetical protein